MYACKAMLFLLNIIALQRVFCSFIYLAPSCFDPGLFPCSLGGSFTNPEALYQFVEKDKERRGSLGSLLCRFFSSCGKDFFCAIGMWAPL